MLRKKRGFSLLELIIAVAILAIITAVAIPVYDGYITRAHRADAKTALVELTQLQESFYADNNTYTNSLDALRANRYGFQKIGDAWHSKEGYYVLTVTGADTRNFTITATARSDGSEFNQDARERKLSTSCLTFSINAVGEKTASAQDCW